MYAHARDSRTWESLLDFRRIAVSFVGKPPLHKETPSSEGSISTKGRGPNIQIRNAKEM